MVHEYSVTTAGMLYRRSQTLAVANLVKRRHNIVLTFKFSVGRCCRFLEKNRERLWILVTTTVRLIKLVFEFVHCILSQIFPPLQVDAAWKVRAFCSNLPPFITHTITATNKTNRRQSKIDVVIGGRNWPIAVTTRRCTSPLAKRSRFASRSAFLNVITVFCSGQSCQIPRLRQI